MTIKQAYKSLGIDTHGLIRNPTFDIDFFNDNGERDETQFTVSSSCMNIPKELAAFFKDFCRENGYKANSVISITLVDDN